MENANMSELSMQAQDNVMQKQDGPVGSKAFDFTNLFLNQVNFNDIDHVSKATKIPVVLPSYEKYREQYSNIPESDAIEIYDQIRNAYALYDSGRYERGGGAFDRIGKVPYSTAGEFYNLRMYDKPEKASIPMSPQFNTGPGFESEPIELASPKMISRSIGHFVAKDGSLVRDTWGNRVGRLFEATPHPDPMSPIPYYYQEKSWLDSINDYDMVRSLWGTDKMFTPTFSKFFNFRGLIGESFGLTLKATGEFIKAAESLGLSANSYLRTGSFYPEPDPENPFGRRNTFLTRTGNSLSAMGAYLSHSNQDEKEGMFNNVSSFSHGLYGGIGQLMSMAFTGRIAYRLGKPFNMNPAWATRFSLGLGSAQNAAHYQQAIIASGGSETDAAAMYVLFFGTTYGANIMIGANLAQNAGVRNLIKVGKETTKEGAELAVTKAGSTIGKMAPQTKNKVAATLAGRSVLALKKAADKTSEVLQNLSEKTVTIGGIKIPWGFNLAMGLEEFVEEGIEELFQMPLENYYNKHFAIPRAKEVNEYYSKYRYDIEYTEGRLKEHVKYNEDGKRIELAPNVWKAEQEDLYKAQNILNGEYPFDGNFSFEEPAAAFLSSVIGGGAVFYVGGGNQARSENDKKFYRQQMAIELSRMSPKARGKAIEKLRGSMLKQQEDSGIFGPDFVTPDGRVVTPEQKAKGDQSVAQLYITQFLQDLQLDVANIDRFKLNHPDAINSTRGNHLLVHEALDVIEAIRVVEGAVEKAGESGVLESNDFLKDGATIEEAKQGLKELQELYKYIVEPKDGPGGKLTSRRFSELHFGSVFLDFVAGLKAKANLNKLFGRELDENAADYNRLLTKEIDRIKNDENELYLLSWLNEPSKILNPFTGTKATNIYAYLKWIYKERINPEMEAIRNERNNAIKESKAVFSEIDRHLSEFEAKSRMFKMPDFSKFQGKEITAAQRQELNQLVSTINELSASAAKLTNIQSYNNLLQDQAQRLTEAFTGFAQVLGETNAYASEITGYATSVERSKRAFMPSNELAGVLNNFLQGSKNLHSQITNPQGFVRDQEIGDFQNEDAKLVGEIRAEAMMRFMDGTYQTGLKEGQQRETIPFSKRLSELKSQVESPHAQLTNAEAIAKELEAHRVNLLGYLEAVDVNANFIQELSEADAEHSMLADGKSEHLKFTKDEYKQLEAGVKEMIADIDAILESDAMKTFSRETDQARYRINDLSLRNYFLGEIYNYAEKEDFGGFQEAYNKVGEKIGVEDAMSFFQGMFKRFNEAKGTEQEKTIEREKIKKTLEEIEKTIIAAEETLSGKLDDFIKAITKKINYNHIQEFGIKAVIERKGNEIKGNLTPEHLSKDSQDISVVQTKAYYLATRANIINRLGRQNPNGQKNFTLSEVLQAYRDVLEVRNTEKVEKEDGKDVTYVVNPHHVGTYEQEQLIVHVLSWLTDQDASNLHSPDVFKDLLQKSLYIRGFAGSGKSTIVITDVIATIEQLTGKSYDVTIVVPTTYLEETHLENLNKLYKSNFKVLYSYQVMNGEPLTGDFVIVDEGGIFSKKHLLNQKDVASKIPILWIGDDAQVPPKQAENFVDLPIKTLAAERTIPVTEVWRSGISQHFALQDHYRSIASGYFSPDVPSLHFELDKDTGVLKGGRYFDTVESLRNSFLDQFDRLPLNERTLKDIIYIVPSSTDFGKVRDFFTKKLGQERADVLMNHVMSVDYVPTEKDFNKLVSGLTSKLVFFEFDPQEFVNRDDVSNQAFGRIDLSKGGLGQKLLAAIGRIGLTGTTRPSSFIGLLGDSKNSSPGRVMSVVAQDIDATTLQKKEDALTRLEFLTDGKTTYKREEGPDKPAVTFNRAVYTTPENKRAISEQENFKGIKQALTQEGIAGMNSYAGQVKHATDLVMLTESVVKSKESKIDNEYKTQSRLKSSYFSNVLRFIMTNDDVYQSAALEVLENLNEHYRAVYADNQARLDKALIANPAEFFATSFLQIQQRFENLVNDPLTIFSPTLFVSDVASKMPSGDVLTVGLRGSPAIMRVIGFDYEGNPVADIEDFVLHDDTNSYKPSDPGPYTKNKMALYAALAQANDIVVNRITLTHYLKDGAGLVFLGHDQMTDEQVIEGWGEVRKVAFLNGEAQIDETFDLSLAREEQVYYNTRVVNDEKYKSGFYHVNKNTGEVVIVDEVLRQADANNNLNMFVAYSKKGDENFVQRVSYGDFENTFIPIKESEEFYDGLKHEQRAIRFVDGTPHSKVRGAFMSHTLVVPVTDNISGLSLDAVLATPLYKARNNMIQKIMRKRNVAIVQNYNGVFENHKLEGKEGRLVPKSFRHVVTNELSPGYMSNKQNIKNVLKPALVEAGIIKENEKVSDEDIITKFKEARFHILGIQNDPEYTFRKQSSNDISILPFAENFLNAETKEVAVDEFKKLKQRIEEGYKGDRSYDKLLAYNLQKLAYLKYLKDNGSAPANISDVHIGNMVETTRPVSGTDFMKKLGERGLAATAIKYRDPSMDTSRAYFYTEVTRDGYPGKHTVLFDAKAAIIDDVSSYIKDLHEFYLKNEEFKKYLGNIERIKNSKKVGETLSREDVYELKEAHKGAMRLIEHTAGFQFLRANRALMLDVYEEIEQEAKKKATTIDGKKVKPRGVLFEFDHKNRLFVVGDSAIQKFTNLNSILNAFKGFMKEAVTTGRTDVVFRKNPFSLDYDQGGATANESRSFVNPENVETSIAEIKTPELYVRPDESSVETPMLVREYLGEVAQKGNVQDGNAVPGNDATNVPLDKRKPAGVDNFQVISAQTAVAQVNAIIGAENAKGRIKITPIEVNNHNDHAYFGRLVNDVLELSGFNIGSELMIQRETPRHEAMHFVMNYMLDYEQNEKVLEDIKKELGRAWDGTIRQLYEHAAEKFEFVDNIKKPKNLFERFMFWLKSFGNKIGLYRFTFNELLYAAETGYYENRTVHQHPNHEFDFLYKSQAKDEYSNPANLKKVIDTFGHPRLYAYYRDYLLAYQLKNYLDIGKSLRSFEGSPSEAIWRTKKFFDNQVFKHLIGERLVDIEGETVAIKDMTPEQFLWLRNNGSNAMGKATTNELMRFYAIFQFSKKFNFAHTVKELFPNSNVELALAVGRETIESNSKTEERGLAKPSKQDRVEGSAATDAYSDRENPRMDNFTNDNLQFALSTVPMYYIKDGVQYYDPNSFVNPQYVKQVFFESYQRLFDQRATDEISFELMMLDIKKHMDENLEEGPVMNAYNSIWVEFGYDDNAKYDADGNAVYDHKDSILTGVGNLAILADPGAFNRIVPYQETDFYKKAEAIRTLHSGIITRFGSEISNRVGVVDVNKGTIDTKNNSAESLEKFKLRDIMKRKTLDDAGFVKKEIGSAINYPQSGFIAITKDGFELVKDVEGGSTVLYSKLHNTKDVTAPQFLRLMEGLGMLGLNINMYRKLLTKQNLDGEVSILDIAHTFMMASKVNYEMTQALHAEIKPLLKEYEKLRKAEDAKTSADPDYVSLSNKVLWDLVGRVDLFKAAYDNMSVEGQQIYDHLNRVFYQYSDKGFAGNYKMEVEYTAPWGDSVFIPSPTDFYKYTELFANMISRTKIDEPSIFLTPEGEPMYSKSPASMVRELQNGSERFVQVVMKDLANANLLGTGSPLLSKQEGAFNNGLLNETVKFDHPFMFTGVKGFLKGKNFKNMTEKDLTETLIRDFFGYSIAGRQSWNRAHVLLSPYGDKGRSFVMPTYFPREGTRGAEAENIVTFKKKGKEITSVEVNYELFVDRFNELVNYYDARRNKSIEAVSRELGIEVKKLAAMIDKDKTIFMSKAEFERVRINLVHGRDYLYDKNPNSKEGKQEYLFKPGRAITQENVVLNSGFKATWDALQSKREKYNLLKSAIAEDFLDWGAGLVDSGVIASLAGDSRLGPYFFSTFKNVRVNDVFRSRKTSDPEALEAEMFGDSVSPDQIGSDISKKITDVRNAWFEKMRYKKDGSIAEAGETFEAFRTEDYNELKQVNPDAASALWAAISNDGPVNKDISAINRGSRKIKKNYAIESVRNMDETAWAPSLEALYFTYWYVNETMAHLTRGDATVFQNPSDYIKRGAGFIAPGTFFDVHNPSGVGYNANVVVLEDIPGFNRFLGVEPGGKLGDALFTDGNSIMNPVWRELLKRSSGGPYGNVGNFANKTVVYGKDFARDNDIYFKFSQLPIDDTHFKSSRYYQELMRMMLGEYYPIFQAYYEETGNLDDASALMADWVVADRNRDQNGILPRDKMVSYIVHPSSFKNGLTGVNSLAFEGDGPKSAFNVRVPAFAKPITVPNKFMRLQQVNHGEGHARLRSFATQLFGVLGVMEHNLPYQQSFNEALTMKLNKFVGETNQIFTENPLGVDRNSGSVTVTGTGTLASTMLQRKQALDYLKKINLDVSSRSIKGTKFEKLLNDPSIVADVLGERFFSNFVSYFNDYLKPDVHGNISVQQSEKMAYYDNGNGAVYTANELGFENDGVDSPSHKRRLLRPITYVNRDSRQAYEDRGTFMRDLDSGQDIVTVPGEVVGRFHYSKKFGIWTGASMHQVFGLTNGETLYESGLQRALGEGATDALQMAAMMIEKSGAKTVGELINSFNSEILIRRFNWWAKEHGTLAAKKLGLLKKDDVNRDAVIEEATQALLNEAPMVAGEQDVVFLPIVKKIAKYYYDLNNAMDMLIVRIPTTNASSASIVRLVNFSETGNSLFTSPEKNILDGSDYDHDELHVFYPALSGRSKVTQLNGRERNDDAAIQNQMLDAVWNFYSDSRNNVLVLAPIKLDSLKEYADEVSDKTDRNNPKVMNTIRHNIHATATNFAGVNLVGHFANQMLFTNKLLSQPLNEITATVHPALAMVVDPAYNPDRPVHIYAQVLDTISKFVNAAVDNAKESGLLGRLSISGPITNLMAGKILTSTPEGVLLDVAEGITSAVETFGTEIEKQVLDMIQSPLVIESSRFVTESLSVKYNQRRRPIWTAIRMAKEKLKNGVTEQEVQEVMNYALIGEQLQRLGSLYKLTQGMKGEKAAFVREVFEIEKALGQTLNEFLDPQNLERVKSVDYADETSRYEEATEQVARVIDSHLLKKVERFNNLANTTKEDIAAELQMRQMINIPRIAATNQLVLSQLYALASFNNVISKVFFNESHPEIKTEVLKAIGEPEMLFEDGFNDYENATKRNLISAFLGNYGNNSLTVKIQKFENLDEVFTDETYDFTKHQDRMRFVVNFYDHLAAWRKMVPDNPFLGNIEFDSMGFLTVPIGKFQSSNYIDPGQKAGFVMDFKQLSDAFPAIAEAIRYYNLLVYGFSARNGSFTDVIDDQMEKNFSEKHAFIEKQIEKLFEEDKSTLLKHIITGADNLLAHENKKADFFKRERSNYYKPSIFMRVGREQALGWHSGADGFVLINSIYPKELYISDLKTTVTNHFVYRNLSKSELMEIHEDGETTKETGYWVGINETVETDPKKVLNIPYDGSYGYTEMGDFVKFEHISAREAVIRRVDPLKESKISRPPTRISRIMGSHAASSLFDSLQSAFPNIRFEFVNDQSSLTSGIGYFFNGKVYINQDKIQADTPIHELTHALLLVMKQVRPAQYQALREEAISMLEANDPLAVIVKDNYKNLRGDDLIDEVISTFVGFRSEQKVMEYLGRMHSPNSVPDAKGIWQKIKRWASNFWSSVKAFFKGYDLTIDPETSTLKDFATQIVDKALKGERVMVLNTSQLKNLALVSSQQVYQQVETKRGDAYGVYDLLMNTGTYEEGGQIKTIKQYRDLTRNERIDEFKKKLPHMGYTYRTFSGEEIFFDLKKQDTWDQLITEKVLSDHDEFGTSMKTKILSALSLTGNPITKIMEEFGQDDYGRPVIEKDTVKRLLNQIRYNPKNKYILYSDLPKSDYAYLYNEDLLGVNPIVSIEYDRDNQLIISLYQITHEYIKRRDKISPLDRSNILAKFINSDFNARLDGLTLESNVGDVSNVLMGLVASHFTKLDKKISIPSVGTISLYRLGTRMALADGLELKQNIEAMLKNKDFVDSLTPQMKRYFENFSLINNAFNLEEVLFNNLAEDEIYEDVVNQFQNGSLNVNDKIRVYNARLRQLIKKGDNLSTADAAEFEMLSQGLATLYNPHVMSDQINTRKDIGKFEQVFSPQYDVGHEFIDAIRRATLAVSQKNVRTLQAFKDTNNEFAAFFEARYQARNGSFEKFMRDATFKYYDEMLATIKDQNGVNRFAGFVLWTTDKNLDPVFAEQAKNVDPEVLKWGKYVTDVITEQMIDNYFHYQTREVGPEVYADGGSTLYTREMAAEDLFEKTTYRRGMLPLMPETVGSLLSQGKLGAATRKRYKQLTSTYVQFEEMSDLTSGQADALDHLPEMFLRQFQKKPSEKIGSLGLAHERMYKMLGLSEIDGKYIYETKSGRNNMFNTDLETLLEFFKMSSIRKINYENEVLPMLNGAILYLNDLQRNKDFTQEHSVKYLELFHNQAILNKRKREHWDTGGIQLDSVAMTAMSYASPLVMALNVNVGAVSAVHNFFMAFIEGIGNNIYNTLNPEERTHWFTTGDLVKASGLFFSDFHKVTQILREFQLLNPNEYELVTHRFNQKRKRHVFSDFYAQITNWGADMYARGVVTIAQMLRDGSYSAYEFDKQTGKLKYNPKKDKQYFDSNGKQSKKQEVLWETNKKNLEAQGWGLDANSNPIYGYDGKQMRTFKGIADKYVVGAYGPMEKNLLSQFLLGRMTMMFTTWLATKVSMAVKKGSYIDEIGYYEIMEDENGNLIPKWQREWTEGYLRTVMRMTAKLFTGDLKQFSMMTPTEKKNWIRYMLTVSFFVMNRLLYKNLVRERKDEDAPIPSSRLVRNWLYAYGSLLIVPEILAKLDSPFAVTGIIKRAWEQGFDFYKGEWWNLRYVMPVVGGAYTLKDFKESFER